MSTDLVQIPKDIPAYLVNATQARAMNDDAVAGVSTGFPPSIRIQGSKFRIVDGNGEETVVKASDLKDSEYLDVVVLAAKRAISKAFYATAYDPNATDAKAPDCYSIDGEKPAANVTHKQAENCAICPNNAFGSGRNQAGQPTKGKACSDNKILAVFRKGTVYQLKIPPASLKNWGLYVKTLSNRGVPVGNVITYIGFSDDSQFPVLEFCHGGWIPEALLPKLAEKAASQETLDVTQPVGFNTAPIPPAQLPESKAAAAAAGIAPPPPAVQMEKPAEQAPAEAVPSRRGRKPSNPAVETAPAATTAPAVVSDEEIAAALGL